MVWFACASVDCSWERVCSWSSIFRLWDANNRTDRLRTELMGMRGREKENEKVRSWARTQRNIVIYLFAIQFSTCRKFCCCGSCYIMMHIHPNHRRFGQIYWKLFQCQLRSLTFFFMRHNLCYSILTRIFYQLLICFLYAFALFETVNTLVLLLVKTIYCAESTLENIHELQHNSVAV